jgi:hypothetical protein
MGFPIKFWKLDVAINRLILVVFNDKGKWDVRGLCRFFYIAQFVCGKKS